MAVTFSYKDYFENNANAEISPVSKVPTSPVSYSQFVAPAQTPAITFSSTPSTGYGAIVGQYGATGVTLTPSYQITNPGTVVGNYGTTPVNVTPTTPTQDEGTGGEGTNTGTGTGGASSDGKKIVKMNVLTGEPPEDITLDKYYQYLYETGLANAQKAQNQALVDAQAQYNQYINPYGTIANQQAALGLTNGGYSEYLQGQAYQGMLNSQNQARANYAQTQQSLYSDYMGNMAQYNQSQRDKADAAAAAKADMLNNIGNYTSEEALGAALDALGITNEAERQTYIDAWTKQKTENETTTTASNNLTMDTYLSGNSDLGEPTEEGIENVGKSLRMSEEEIEEWKTKFRDQQYANFDANGDWGTDDWQGFFDDDRYENLSPEQKEAADAEYSDFIARNLGYDSTTGATTSFFVGDDGVSDITDKDEAKKLYEEAMADPHYTQDLKDAIKKEYEAKYLGGRTVEDVDLIEKARGIYENVKISDSAKIVDVNSNTFTSDMFGKFNDTGKAGSGQENLISAIVEAAKNDQIKDGECVIVNYGRNPTGGDIWMYVDGKFVKLEGTPADITFADIPGYEIETKSGIDGGKKIASYTITATKE